MEKQIGHGFDRSSRIKPDRLKLELALAMRRSHSRWHLRLGLKPRLFKTEASSFSATG
jgi:hypothetical protein